MKTRRGRAALAAVLLTLAGPACRSEPAHRVLSLNLCSDQLLLALADPADVAGVTWLARDCRISAACAAASQVPARRGTAEEVIALRPDLVLAGAGNPPPVQAAALLGILVLPLPPASSLEDIRTQIAQVAVALGREERGAALLAEFDSGLADVPAAQAGRRLNAAVYEPNGFTAGAGSLQDSVLARAGLENWATQRGHGAYGRVPLEELLLHPPSLLITAPPGAPSLAESMLSHPALGAAFAGRRVEIPPRDWICGGPATIDAVARLARARDSLGR